jgi:hypothetical protein
MKELMTTTELVKNILETDERTRNSDSFLYFKVLEVQGREKGVDIHGMNIPTFLLHMTEYGFAPFETVRRTRQAIQAKYPYLAGNATVTANRTAREEEFREYARAMK